MSKISRMRIKEFLSAKRMAVIGVSRSAKEYSRLLFRELLKNGYDAVPINPAAEEVDGKTCYRSIKDIVPAPERAVIILPEGKIEQAILECADAGVRDVWVHPLSRSDRSAIALGEQKGLTLITGFCMFMFLPNTSFVHRLHGGILKLVGAYPR